MLTSSMSYATVIWEKSSVQNGFSFCGLNSVSYAFFSSDSSVMNLESLIQQALHNRAKLNIGSADSLDIDALNAKVKFYITANKIKEGLVFLNMEAMVNATAQNQAPTTASVWKRFYLIETPPNNTESFKKEVSMGLAEFMDIYFRTNPSSQNEARFYLVN